MLKVKVFTNQCEEIISKPIMNYAVVHDNEPKRSACFANALIDEQVILCATGENQIDDKYLEQVVAGCESEYPDSVIYFFPKKDEAKVKEIIDRMVQEWTTGKSKDISYSRYGDIYIALRHSNNGFWGLTYDATTFVTFEVAQTMFDNDFKIESSHRNKNLNTNTPFVACTSEESSGESFFTNFKRKKLLFSLMKSEGIYDENCEK